MAVRIGAYILPGDPVWLHSSLTHYYDLLDDLVVVVPDNGRGWTGRPIPVDACLRVVDGVDVRRIARRVHGVWTDLEQPMRADTAQRQAGIDALGGSVDWILQVDNDEVLPDPSGLVALAATCGDLGRVGVEWPMRVLFRRMGVDTFLEVSGSGGRPVYEYPGCVLVRSGVRLNDARRPDGRIVRMLVGEDDLSLQNRQAVSSQELRMTGLTHDQAIVHNSWGRTPGAVWRKTRTWGHASGWRGVRYYLLTWLPAPVIWRHLRDFHPFARDLWPELRKTLLAPALLDDVDR